LVFIAVLAGFSAMNLSYADPSTGVATFSIVFGLAAIAAAILTVGRKINI
jgi:hypothetical protein